MDSESSAQERLAIIREDDIVAARQRVRTLSRDAGFGMVDQSRITTAVSELTRNIVRYAENGQGEVLVNLVTEPTGRSGIEVIVRDEGPGIADLDSILNGSFTSSHGLGMGLTGTRRLMDEMDIDTEPGRGTIVTIRKWLR